GLDHEQHGLFGSLKPVAPGTPEGPAEAQKVIAAADVFQLDLNQLVKDISSGASQDTINRDVQTATDDFKVLVKTELAFIKDTNDAKSSHPGHKGSGDNHTLDALFAEFEDILRNLV